MGVGPMDVSNVSDMEAQKQVMSPIVDHFVALQADFQKQLAALRELTDNWRHEKDPPNKLGNNMSDNLYDRSDEPTVLIDANLVPRAVQQALDVAEPSDLANTRQEPATVDSRNDSKYLLKTTKSTEGLNQVDAALPTEIPTTTVDDLVKTSAADSSRALDYSSKIDDTDRSIGESSMIDIDKTVVRITESDLPKSDGEKSDVKMKQIAQSHEETGETHAGILTTSIDETAVVAEVTNLPEGQERLLPNNAGVEVFLLYGTSALDTTNNTEPGQSSSTRQETSSGPELPSDIARQSTATGNNESLEVGKSAELSGALRISFQNSSVPQQADILPRRTSSRDESSIADTTDETEKAHADASERDLSAPGQSDQDVIKEIPRQNDEPPIVAVEALLSAVKSLPEQFLTSFITAMQMLSPEKNVNITSDVQLMNQLNTLHNITIEDPKTSVSESEIINRTNVDVLQQSVTTDVIDTDEEKPVSAAVLENKTGSQSFREKEDIRSEKDPEKSSRIIDKEISRSKFSDSRMMKSRSSVPDIKQQHQDVRSVRIDTNESNISTLQTNIATDLTSETFSDSMDVMDKDTLEESRAVNEAGTSSVGIVEASQTDVAEQIYSRKNSLEIVDTPARNNNQGESVGEESVSKARSAEEMHSGESSSSHVQQLTASSTHNQSIVQKPVEFALGNCLTDASSSSSKEARNSSEKASHEKLLVAIADIDLILKSDSSRDESSLAFINDSNAEKPASQSMTETNVSQEDPIVHNFNVDHSPVSYEVTMNAINTTNKQDINKQDERQLNDSSHAHVSVSASPISSSSSAKVSTSFPDHFLDVKSPPVEIFDNHETILRHDKNDTKPIAPKNAVHVSEKVEQTISVTYHTPASDDKNETTLKENVPVEQNTANDLSIAQSRTDESILSPLTHSHAAMEMNLNNLDQRKEITFVLAKNDSSIEQTSDIQSLTDSQDIINQDKLFNSTNEEIIAFPCNHLTHAKEMSPSFSKNNLDVNTCPENISHLKISNNFGDPKTSKDIKLPENSKAVSISEISKPIVDGNSVNINKFSDENVHSQLCELSKNDNNIPDNTSPRLSIEHVLPLESKESISYPIDRDEELYLEDGISQSHDDKKQNAQISNSMTRNILHTLKNLNIFFATPTEQKNNASTVDEDPFPDPVTANVSDVTPGIPDTFEIKISESPVTTVNDCAPIKNIRNIVERETSQIEGVENAKDSGNEISVVTHNEQVEPLKLPTNESSIEKNTEQVNQSCKSVIAKHRSRSPLKKIVRRKSPVKIIKKSGSVPKKNLARKSANPYNTTVAKAKAMAGEITSRSNRAMQSDESRIKEVLKPMCIANDKRDDKNKLVVKKPNKPVKQSLNNTSVQKAARDVVNDNKKISTSGIEKISIVNNATNLEPQIKLSIVKKYNGNKSENFKKRTPEYSKNKNIEDVQNKSPRGSKNIKAEILKNQAIKKINHKTEISNDDKILIKTEKDNLKSKASLPSKIPILIQRKNAQPNTLSSSSKINDMSLLKNASTKLPIMSQAISKLSLKIQERTDVSKPPITRKIESKDTNKLRRNQIKSNNGRAIEITENVKDKQILEENHAKENTVENEEIEEPSKVKSIELELSENSQALNSTHNDPSADLSKQLEVENAIEESSDTFSDSECSEEDEDTGTAKYISDHNSEYNSVEEFTDAELLLEKTLNEIRSEISESEEECTSKSEESEDVTYSYETESHDHDSTSSEGRVDEQEIKSSEMEDSVEEGVYEELPSEGEEMNEEVKTSEQFKVLDRETDDIIHNEMNDNEANISNRMESNSQVTQRDKGNNLKTPVEAAIIELSQPEINAGINEKTLEIAQNLKTDSDTTVIDAATASSAKLRQNINSKEKSKMNDSKKNETKLEDASEIEEGDQSTVQNNMIKTLRVTSQESREKRVKVGRRASTGSKEIEKDDMLKGVDRARAPKKRFSLVASCIRRFEGEENAERAHVESIRRMRQGSPKTEREVSRRELPSDTRPPHRNVSCREVLANVRREPTFSTVGRSMSTNSSKCQVGGKGKIERNR